MAKAKASTKKKTAKMSTKKAAPAKKAAAKKPSRYCLGRCARCTGGCSLNRGHDGAHDCGTH